MGVDLNTALGPKGLANNALQATNQGAWLGVAGSSLNTIANTAAGMYQSRVAFNNAASYEQDAAAAIQAGTYREEQSRIATSQRIGQEKVNYAAGNIDVTGGSAKKVQTDTQAIGDLDANIIKYNAEREATSDLRMAQNARSAGRFGELSTAFNALGGIAKTYGSYLSGSQALANQKLLLRQSGMSDASTV